MLAVLYKPILFDWCENVWQYTPFSGIYLWVDDAHSGALLLLNSPSAAEPLMTTVIRCCQKLLHLHFFVVVLFLQTAGSCAYRSVTARESRSDDFKKTDIYGAITRPLSWSSTSLFFQSWPEKSLSDTCDSITALKIPTWCFEHITHWTHRAEWIVVICEYR